MVRDPGRLASSCHGLATLIQSGCSGTSFSASQNAPQLRCEAPGATIFPSLRRHRHTYLGRFRHAVRRARERQDRLSPGGRPGRQGAQACAGFDEAYRLNHGKTRSEKIQKMYPQGGNSAGTWYKRRPLVFLFLLLQWDGGMVGLKRPMVYTAVS